MTERKDRMRRIVTSPDGWVRGYFTVEMTLLMCIALPAILSVMLAGFYIHDRNCMQSEACELSALGSCMRVYDDCCERIGKRAGELRGGRLSWTGGITASSSAGKKSASGKLTGQFAVPGLIAGLWTGGTVSMEEEWTFTITDPSAVIRKLRGAKAAVKKVTGS